MTQKSRLSIRYVAKLASNVVVMFANIFINALVMRALGPASFGSYTYITGFFNKAWGFLDFGMSNAFYTKLSARPKEYRIIGFFFWYTVLVLSALLFLVFLSCGFGFTSYFWPGENQETVFLGFIWIALFCFSHIFEKISDAYALTVITEITRVSQLVLGAVAVYVLYRYDLLGLKSYFIYNFAVFFAVSVGFGFVILRKGYSIGKGFYLKRQALRKYFKEFFRYCSPLMVYTFAGFLAGIFDLWLLKYFHGNVQQGYLGLSTKIGGVCFMFTSAMTPLMVRELSVAYKQKNLNRMKSLFMTNLPAFFSLTAYLSCFSAVNSRELALLFGGQGFKGADLAVTIMVFYPLQQVLGQMNGSVFYSTGKTSLFRNLSLTAMFIGIPMSFFFIAPVEYFGFNMGASGLAMKIVLTAFIGSNIKLFFSSKILSIKYVNFLRVQIIPVLILILAAWLAGLATSSVFDLKGIVYILVSGILYTMVTGVIVVFFPSALGMRKKNLLKILSEIKGFKNGI